MGSNYISWCKKYREYTEQGNNMLHAWYLANRDFEMDMEETESYFKYQENNKGAE